MWNISVFRILLSCVLLLGKHLYICQFSYSFLLAWNTVPCRRWKKSPGSSWYIAWLSNNMFIMLKELPPVTSTEVTHMEWHFILSMPRRMIVNIFFQVHHSESFRFKKFQVDYTKWISSKDKILQVTSPSFSDHLSSFFIHLLTVILISCYLWLECNIDHFNTTTN